VLETTGWIPNSEYRWHRTIIRDITATEGWGDSYPSTQRELSSMPSIAQDLQQMLDLASQYSPDPTPAMLQRVETAADLAGTLGRTIQSMADVPGLAELDLQVRAGGRRGHFSPFPWVRLYSQRYAPTAQEGIYLVYLFAADGSRVYLSLNQGTSEFRGGDMRAITDRLILLARAAQARSTLGDLIESEGAAGAVMSIDLAWQGLESWDSRHRGRAYEDANILARAYPSGLIPSDQQLLSDLVGMLPLLVQLYGETPTTTAATLHARNINGQRLPAKVADALSPQGRLLDTAVRKKVELYAEDHAVEYFSQQGWKVSRIGHLKLGYDLACERGNDELLHVEVKGTQTAGEKVALTWNEVRHNCEAAECAAIHALYVVSMIRVSLEGDIECSAGEANFLLPWRIDDDDLIPTEYSYKVPYGQARN
jgi:hypothetical protein